MRVRKFSEVVAALSTAGVRFVVMGVWGANYYAAGTLFVTQDQDLFLPPDSANWRDARCRSEREQGLDVPEVRERAPERRRNHQLAQVAAHQRCDGDVAAVENGQDRTRGGHDGEHGESDDRDENGEHAHGDRIDPCRGRTRCGRCCRAMGARRTHRASGRPGRAD